jgi:hypothetical protein
MILDYADMIPQAVWAEAYSTTVYIKNCLPHSTFKYKKLLYKIMLVINLRLRTYILFVLNAMYTYLKKNRLECPSLAPEKLNALL